MLERGYMCPDIQQIADSRGMDNDSILDTTLTDGENAENESVDKKRRRSFTYAFKCEVRDEFNRGDISISALARKYTVDRVGRGVVSDLCKRTCSRKKILFGILLDILMYMCFS